jgi:hypothetical protein
MSAGNLEKLRLSLNPGATDGSTRTYDIYPISTVDISTTKDAFSIAPPGLSARENILLGISGMQADISITATAWDDGTDRANGSHTATVTTVEEQLAYLEDDVHAPDFGASWELDHLTGSAINDAEVFLESVDKTVISQGSPKWKEFTLRLRRGQSIG